MYHVENTIQRTIPEAIEDLTECVVGLQDRNANEALATLLEASDRRIEVIERAMHYVLGAAVDGDIKARRLYLEMRAALSDQTGTRSLPQVMPVFEDAA